MINDKEVKTVVSPFAVRENEVKVFDGKEGFASINQVVFKMDMGYINELHIKVLEVVNEFTYVTSRQVTQIMNKRNKLDDIDIDKRQDKVAKMLEDLTKSKVLARYYFESATGKSSFRTYGLDKLATYILKQRNIVTTWQPTDNIKAAYELKRKLAGNQLIIAYMEKVASFVEVDTGILLFSKKYNVKFKPTGGKVILKQDKKEFNYIFEVVRRNEDWQNMFATKVQLYSDFYENFSKGDSNFSEVPRLVFVGEDVNHLAEMFRIIKQISTFLKDEDMYFTVDLKQLEDSIEESISIFEQDKVSKKYKLIPLKLEILKKGENSDNSEIKADKKFAPNMIIE
ncbi:MAG: hypothetical protein RSE41_03850 [Clostridia bacterium]